MDDPLIYEGIELGDAVVSGQLVKAARLRRGLSVRALAKKLSDGTHFTTISKIEGGKMHMTETWLNRLSEALEVPILELVSGSYAEGPRPSVPFFSIDDWKERKKVLGYVAANQSAAYKFALQGKYANPYTYAYHRIFIFVDYDDKQLHDKWIYLLDIGRSAPFFGVYFERPARFDRWLFADDAPFMVGDRPFQVIGRLTYYSEVL